MLHAIFISCPFAMRRSKFERGPFGRVLFRRADRLTMTSPASIVEPFFWRRASGQRRSSAVRSGDDDDQLAAFNYKLYIDLYGGSILNASELAADELQTRSLPSLHAASRPASASRPPATSRPPSPSVGEPETASRVASHIDGTPTMDAALANEQQQLCMMQPMSNSVSFKGHYQRPPSGFAQVSLVRKCTRRTPDADDKLLALWRAPSGTVAGYAPAVTPAVIQRTEASAVALRRTSSSLALERLPKRLPRPRLMQGLQGPHERRKAPIKAPTGEVNTTAASQYMSSRPKNVPIFSNQMYYLYFYSHTMQGVGALNFGRDAGNEVERLQGKETYWRLQDKEARDVRRARANEAAKVATRLQPNETFLEQVLRAAVQTEEVTEEEARVAMAERLARVVMAERLEVMEETIRASSSCSPPLLTTCSRSA